MKIARKVAAICPFAYVTLDCVLIASDLYDLLHGLAV